MAFPINPSPGDTYTDAYGTVWVYAGAVNGWYRQSVNPGNETDYRTGDGYVGSDLDVLGDLTLDDGGTYATTLQLITPTANRTISFPDATGTVGLVGGSSGQLIYNNAGAYAGASSTSVGATGNITLSLAGAASTPPVSLTGTWFSGGTSTTTKPQLLIEPTGTTSTAWSTSGTGLGVNAASGFAGNLFDFQVAGSSKLALASSTYLRLGSGTGGIQFNGDTAAANALDDYEEGTFTPTITQGVTSPTYNTSNTTGVYRIVGKQLFFSLRVHLTGGTADANQLIVGGLPINIVSNSNVYQFPQIGRFQDGASNTGVIAIGQSGTITLAIIDASDRTAVTGTEATNTLNLQITGSYPIN